MIKCIGLVIAYFLFCNLLYANDGQPVTKAESSISIKLHVDLAKMPDSVSLKVMRYPDEVTPDPQSILVRKSKKDMQWVIQSNQMVDIIIESVKPLNSFSFWTFEPGDDVTVGLWAGKLTFTGKGSEKLNLCNDVFEMLESVKKPANPFSYVTLSKDDYLEYSKYLNDQWKLIKPVFDSYKGRMPAETFDCIKAKIIHRLEKSRTSKFYSLYIYYCKKGLMSLEGKSELSRLYDSTFFSKHANWMREQPFYFIGTNAFYGFIRNQIVRKLNFPIGYSSKEHLADILEEGKKHYNGLAREYFLYTTITKLIIEEFGFTSETDVFLNIYYKNLTLPSYKQQVRKFEYKTGEIYKGKYAPLFNQRDLNGKIYNNKSIFGKLVLLNFCMGDCRDCIDTHLALKEIQARFNYDSNFLVLNIISSFKNNQFNDGICIPVGDSSILKAFGVYNGSGLRLIGPNGKIVAEPVPDPGKERNQLEVLIKQNLDIIEIEQWAITNDGPYVLHDSDAARALYVFNNKSAEKKIEGADILLVSTDIPGARFGVSLKKEISIEPCVYSKPSRLLAISDIEGNFDALRALLQANNVIDEDFNWTFGTGHLVLVGDMVDRGNQVTECLWLIYKLEEKAKAAGGYVHFILGNHEIMNLNGDIRYVQNKYKRNAILLDKDYSHDLYGERSELGKWLRSKNIVEKIGDILFVHAGISKEVNNQLLAVNKLNELARPYYDKETLARESSNKALSLLYDPRLSPFWYRLYYLKDSMRLGVGANRIDTTFKTPVKVVNQVLTNYNVGRIVTGHTIYKVEGNPGKYVSMHYNGKVINLDTEHAKGHSEALLIEDKKYFRVNKEGDRVFLFEE
jgi:hypothetical protein